MNEDFFKTEKGAFLATELYRRTIFLMALGRPLKPSAEFTRIIEKAKEDINQILLEIKLGIPSLQGPLSKEERSEMIRIAKEKGIRPVFLEGELD